MEVEDSALYRLEVEPDTKLDIIIVTYSVPTHAPLESWTDSAHCTYFVTFGGRTCLFCHGQEHTIRKEGT